MSNAVAKLLPTHDNSLHRFPGANDSAIMPIMTCSVAWEGRGCGFSTAIRPAYGRTGSRVRPTPRPWMRPVPPRTGKGRCPLRSCPRTVRPPARRWARLPALHRADLPEQPFRGGDLFDGFAQDEVHRHGEAPHELGDAYQCDHHALPYSIVRADSGTSSAAKAGANSVAMNRGPDAMRRMRAPAATELTIPPMPLHVAARPTAT